MSSAAWRSAGSDQWPKSRALARLLSPKETGKSSGKPGTRATGALLYSDHVIGQGKRFFEQARARGLEGIISKRGDFPYHGGRSKEWLKVKCLKRQEFVIVGFTDPEGSREAINAWVEAETAFVRQVVAGARPLIRKRRANATAVTACSSGRTSQ